MKVYIRGDNGNFLMHSDTYLGEDYISPNLVHWKYIKKEKKNGRWVYYYDDSAYKVTDKEYLHDWVDQYNAKGDYKAKKDSYESMKKAVKKAKNDPKEGKEYVHPFVSERNEKYLKGEAEKSKKVYDNASKKFNNTKNKYDSYNKTSEKIRRGLAKIGAKTLNAASSAIYKGKSLLKKIFG